MSAPFRVFKRGQCWFVETRHLPRTLAVAFITPGEAIDYVYEKWPWWP